MSKVILDGGSNVFTCFLESVFTCFSKQCIFWSLKVWSKHCKLDLILSLCDIHIFFMMFAALTLLISYLLCYIVMNVLLEWYFKHQIPQVIVVWNNVTMCLIRGNTTYEMGNATKSCSTSCTSSRVLHKQRARSLSWP